MFEVDPLLPVMAAAAGVVAGVVLGRLARGIGASGASARETEHRLRSVEAELRVAQRAAEQMRALRGSESEELQELRAEVGTLKEQAGLRQERIARLQEELRFERRKTDQLRQELCDRAEEMVRTHVQLRDAETELGVAMVGSDVVVDQIVRLEQEREELNALVENLKRELASRTAAGAA